MKVILSFITFFSTVSSFAFTTQNLFQCQNGDRIVVTSSLMPNGQRFNTASSAKYPNLVKKDCSAIAEKWNSHGLDNCFANETVLFTHFNQSGTLQFKMNGQTYFTICTLINSIQ
jgi:hypothetical protein